MTYLYIVFRYLSTVPKKQPKFQYWQAGTEDEISNWNDYENREKLELDKSVYTKTFTIAKAIIDATDVNKVKNKMAKSFTEFSIKHSEPITIGDITQFENITFPNFKGLVNV